MRMSDENFRYPAHLYSTLLNLMLSGFAAIEKPSITVQTKCERRVIARRGRLGRSSSEESQVESRDTRWRHVQDGFGRQYRRSV